MNIHEHQAKEILKEFEAPVSNGIVIFSTDEINEKVKQLNKDIENIKLKFSIIKKISEKNMWLNDLNDFSKLVTLANDRNGWMSLFTARHIARRSHRNLK